MYTAFAILATLHGIIIFLPYLTASTKLSHQLDSEPI